MIMGDNYKLTYNYKVLRILSQYILLKFLIRVAM